MCNIAEFTNSKKDKLYAEISCKGCEPLGRKQEQAIQSLKKKYSTRVAQNTTM